ncbi:MAG TPA: hypothetical protein VFD84_08590 [Candidatus Binatia bacterium]|nr:hypothetical protein [Candidatus Binatia bacterium]
MAKRMLLHFQKGGFPAYEQAEEDGYPQPCALGVPWVNEDTQRTLARLRIPKTDPWGRPLPGGPVGEDPRVGIQADPPAGARGGLIAEDPEAPDRRDR